MTVPHRPANQSHLSATGYPKYQPCTRQRSQAATEWQDRQFPRLAVAPVLNHCSHGVSRTSTAASSKQEATLSVWVP